MYLTVIDTPLHPIVIEVSNIGLKNLILVSNVEKKRMEMISGFQSLPSQMEKIHFDATCDWLAAYFLGQKTVAPNLDLSQASEFQERVWRALFSTIVGIIITYSELAAISGSPRAARAVGSAMASNPICLIIPCHRVVKADANLGQYSGYGGIESKRWLIGHEAAMVALVHGPPEGGFNRF
jgi:methylated-DNA-[protein]-cysteine S-methyltransferase